MTQDQQRDPPVLRQTGIITGPDVRLTGGTEPLPLRAEIPEMAALSDYTIDTYKIGAGARADLVDDVDAEMSLWCNRCRASTVLPNSISVTDILNRVAEHEIAQHIMPNGPFPLTDPQPARAVGIAHVPALDLAKVIEVDFDDLDDAPVESEPTPVFDLLAGNSGPGIPSGPAVHLIDHARGIDSTMPADAVAALYDDSERSD